MKFEELIKKPVAVFLVTSALMVAGLIQVVGLPIKLYPNTQKTRISVRIPHPSTTAAVFEREYNQTIMDALATIDGVDEVETSFANGSTRILVWFDWNISGDDARSRVSTAMSQVQSRLPEESDDLSVRYWAGRSSGFYSIAAYSDQMKSKEVFELLDPKIRPQLNKLKNVDIARINPVEETRVEIILDPLSLVKYGLTPDEVASAIRGGYRDLSLGSYRTGRDSYSVRIARDINDFEDIKDIIIATSHGTKIYLSDVADVQIFSGLPRRLYSVDGKSAVIIFAMPNQDGNIRTLAAEINGIIDNLRPTLPDHIKFQKLVDPGEYINAAIENVIYAGLIGGALAIVITFLFLGEPRNTILIAVSIPLSLILSFNLLRAFDVTINLISLSGLMLAVGMIVDASIVVIENIFRHLKEDSNGLSRTEVIVKAVAEVRGAIIASTLTTVVVFLPISFTSELTSAILGDLSRAVIFVISCSAVIALVVVPAIAAWVFARPPKREFRWSLGTAIGRLLDRLIATYRRALGFLLATRSRSIAAVGLPLLLLIALIVFVAPRIQREIMAKPDSPRITLEFENLETTEQEDLLRAIVPLEQKLLEIYGDQISNLFAQIRGSNDGEFTMTMKSTELREKAMLTLQEHFKSDDTWTYEIERWNPAELPLPRTYDLKISFYGEDPVVISGLMRQTIQILRKSDLYGEVRSDPKADLASYIVLKPRHEVVGEVGAFTLEKLSNIGKVALTGRTVVEMMYNEEPMNIEVSYPKAQFRGIGDIMNLLVNTSFGGLPFKHFFNAAIEKGMPEIVYLDSERVFNVTADMKETTPKWHREQLEARATELIKDQLVVPDGYSYTFDDTQKDINDSILSLVFALALSVFLIYVVLGAQFNSLIAPVIIMFSVPMGLIGVIVSLFIAGSTISLNSMLGAILLGGIGVNNSILIYDFFLKVKDGYSDHREALLHACGLRVVPIMITSLTTVLGMMPIAFAMGDGTNVIQPLGIAIAGGLGIATLLTLFVVPCILNLVDMRQNRSQT